MEKLKQKKSSFALYHDGNLSAVLRNLPGSNRVLYSGDGGKVEHGLEFFKNVFLIGESDLQKHALPLIQGLQQKGTSVHLLPIEKIMAGDFSSYHRFGRYIIKRLKMGPAMVLYRGEAHGNLVEGFLACTLLSRAGSRLTASQALKKIRGKATTPTRADRIVYEYNHFIDPSAPLPDFMDPRPRRETPTPDSVGSNMGSPRPSRSLEKIEERLQNLSDLFPLGLEEEPPALKSIEGTGSDRNPPPIPDAGVHKEVAEVPTELESEGHEIIDLESSGREIGNEIVGGNVTFEKPTLTPPPPEPSPEPEDAGLSSPPAPDPAWMDDEEDDFLLPEDHFQEDEFDILEEELDEMLASTPGHTVTEEDDDDFEIQVIWDLDGGESPAETPETDTLAADPIPLETGNQEGILLIETDSENDTIEEPFSDTEELNPTLLAELEDPTLQAEPGDPSIQLEEPIEDRETPELPADEVTLEMTEPEMVELHQEEELVDFEEPVELEPAPQAEESESYATPSLDDGLPEPETIDPEIAFGEPESEAAVETEGLEFESPEPATESEPDSTEVQTSPPAAPTEESPELVEAPVRKKPVLSIKLKLISVITGMIIVALSGMILLATGFFKSDSEKRIQENNLALTEVIGQKIELEFNSIIFRARSLATTINARNLVVQRDYLDLFFQTNQEIAFVGFASRGDGSFKYRKEYFNETFLDDNGLTKESIRSLHALNEPAFAPAFGGAIVVHNASPGSTIPLIGVSLPEPGFTGDEIIVLYINPSKILKTFNTSGITTTYMVNNRGDIIAHPDSRLVLSRTNLADFPIVRNMMASTLDNGQTRFKDNEGVYHLGSFKKLNISGLGIISTVEEARAFEEVYNIQRRNLYIMIIVINISIFVIFFFSRTITVPIVNLVAATLKIESGDYQVTLKKTSKDEIGMLTESFSRMARGLEEREKMKDAFGRFVNKELAEKAMRGEIKLGGEKKEAAIFFSDLRGFTAMSEGLTPEQVVDVLNEYFTDMVACVNDTMGVVDKFIGDAIMAHWGAVSSHGNDTENAVNAALMMRAALYKYNERQKNAPPGKGKPELRFGCGINTGSVISGQIGSETRLEFTVIGDAVNLASRIEALNKPFGTDVLISQDSYDTVSHLFEVEKMPAIKVKGKTEPQTIYAVLGKKGDPDCPKSMDEIRKIHGIKTPDQGKAGQDVLEEDKEVKYEIIEE